MLILPHCYCVGQVEHSNSFISKIHKQVQVEEGDHHRKADVASNKKKKKNVCMYVFIYFRYAPLVCVLHVWSDDSEKWEQLLQPLQYGAGGSIKLDNNKKK